MFLQHNSSNTQCGKNTRCIHMGHLAHQALFNCFSTKWVDRHWVHLHIICTYVSCCVNSSPHVCALRGGLEGIDPFFINFGHNCLFFFVKKYPQVSGKRVPKY